MPVIKHFENNETLFKKVLVSCIVDNEILIVIDDREVATPIRLDLETVKEYHEYLGELIVKLESKI